VAPLDKYREKRDFSLTPEPTGGASKGESLRFVVQQHHASRMHWDFRLELDGVLMSWAVPKGPSLDPAEKRLAVHVEDHPLDYASFEGVIPAGEYGGGNVIVWDAGTWEPMGDPHAGMAKGDFKFHLSGEKLLGGWVLVRLKPRGNERGENWLLIKERDEHVRPHSEYSITAERPDSVVSGLSVDEVAEGASGGVAEGQGLSPSATPPDALGAAGPSPGKAQPVESPLQAPPELALCTLVSEVPGGDGWLGEVKYDGYRLTIALRNGAARCYSRNGADVTERFELLARAAEGLPAVDALLDGEAVVFDERGVSGFGELQRALSEDPGRIAFAAFDLLHLNGYDVSMLPTSERKDLLATLLAEQPEGSPLRFAEYVTGDVSALLEVACDRGLEGVVAKRADAPYPRGRTRSWLKIKCRRAQEFVVGGWTEPAASRAGFGALLLGTYEEGRLAYAGRVGSGFDERMLADIGSQLREIERPDSPFASPPTRLGKHVPHWVEPLLVAQVAFTEWTSEGLLRQPSFKGLRDDVEPGSVRRERAADSPEGGADGGGVGEVVEGEGLSPSADLPDTPASASVLGVRVSNPGKRLFPDSGLSKVELAEYYAQIAPLMLLEVANRPLTLVRCPVGDGRGKCFYQRHPDKGLSAHVHPLVHALKGHAEPDEWLYVSDAEGLVALAQMGVAEIHTWLSRTDAPLRPDRIVFDLDPGPDVDWAAIASAAHIVREECASLGFTPHLKSTGSKGLHVVLPIEPVWEFERIRAFAHSVAERVAARHPDRLTPKMAKNVRQGRIFLDYVRNSEGASAVAPYSARYLAGPPIAVPLAWEELDDASLDIRAFTPARVLERAAAGVDPWAGLADAAAGVRVLKSAEETLGS